MHCAQCRCGGRAACSAQCQGCSTDVEQVVWDGAGKDPPTDCDRHQGGWEYTEESGSWESECRGSNSLFKHDECDLRDVPPDI